MPHTQAASASFDLAGLVEQLLVQHKLYPSSAEDPLEETTDTLFLDAVTAFVEDLTQCLHHLANTASSPIIGFATMTHGECEAVMPVKLISGFGIMVLNKDVSGSFIICDLYEEETDTEKDDHINVCHVTVQHFDKPKSKADTRRLIAELRAHIANFESVCADLFDRPQKPQEVPATPTLH